jgi:hypothetical protein
MKRRAQGHTRSGARARSWVALFACSTLIHPYLAVGAVEPEFDSAFLSIAGDAAESPFRATAGVRNRTFGDAVFVAEAFPVLAYTASAERGRFEVDVDTRVMAQLGVQTRDGRSGQADVSLQPRVSVKLPSGVKISALAVAKVDTFDSLEKGDVISRELSRTSRPARIGDRTTLELRELYVQGRVGKSEVKIGRQQTPWGNAMGLKVLDVVNPVDFSEFILPEFDDSRIPLYSINVETPIGESTLRTVWVLDQTYADLPPPGSTFEFTTPLLIPRKPTGLPFPVIVDSIDRPGRLVRDSDVGFEFATALGGVDLSLNYLYHYDDIPIPFVTPPNGPGEALLVDLEYRRTHLIGGTAAKFVGPLRLRTEFGYSTDKYLTNENPNDRDRVSHFADFSYVLGFDFFGLPRTIMSFQFFQNIISRDANDEFLERDTTETNMTFFLRRTFLDEKLEFRTIVLHSLNRADGILRPRFTYTARDNMNVYLGADVFYGTKGGFFGQFKERDRIVLGLELRL